MTPRGNMVTHALRLLALMVQRAPVLRTLRLVVGDVPLLGGVVLMGYVSLLMSVRLVGVQVLPHYDALLLTTVVAAVVRCLQFAKPAQRGPALVVVAWTLIATFLWDQWQTGVGGRHALVGGIIPWADASDFLAEALRKAHGLPFTAHGSKRPLFPLLLAFVLRCTQLHLRTAVCIFAFAGATILGAATELIWRKTGARGAFCALLLLLFYARRYLVVIGTESLGFLLGGFAFLFLGSALWRVQAEAKASSLPAATGAFFLALGLAARAGPMFALPAVWLVVALRAKPNVRVRATLMCVAASTLAFAANQCIILTSGAGGAFSDYPAIFYGMLHGEDFTYFAQLHPKGTDIYGVISSELQAQPSLLVLGMMRSIGAFVFGPHGLFSIGWYNPDDQLLEVKGAASTVLRNFVTTAGVYRSLNLMAMAACSCAFVLFVLCWATQLVRKQAQYAASNLLFAVLCGVVLSSAFTPPWITEGSQLQATTICFLVAIPGAWLHRKTAPSEQTMQPLQTPRAAVSAVALTSSLLGAAWLTMRLIPYPIPPTSHCHEGTPYLRILPGSAVAFVEGETRGYNVLHFRNNMAAMRKNFSDFVIPVAALIAPRHTFQYAFDGCSHEGKVLILQTQEAERLGAGQWATGPATPIDILHRVLLSESSGDWQSR